MTSKYAIAILLGIAGVLLFSLKAILVKYIYVYEIDPVSLVMFRMLFALPFYIIVLFLSKKTAFCKTKIDYIRLVIFGLLGYFGASLLDFIGLSYIKASLERIILFLYPSFVLLLSWIILNKKAQRFQIIAIILAYIGVIMCFAVEFNQVENTNAVWKGGIFILLCAICYAAYLVGSEQLIPKFGAVRFTSYSMIIATIAILLVYFLQPHPQFWDYPNEVYLISLVIAIFCTVIPSYMVSFSIKVIGANNFGVISSLGPVSTIIMAFIFLGEVLSFLQIVGALVVIIAVYIITQRK